MTVVETEQFVREANGLMTESERLELIAYVASSPESGDVMRDRRRSEAALGRQR
jgi:hypothetical protein